MPHVPRSVEPVAPVICCNGLTRRFGELTAVDRLDLEVPPGEVFGLVGPDGAGKTTTLRLLSGLLEPSEGIAVVAGFDASRQIDELRDRIGYMAQRFGLYHDLTVEENMAFYADLFGIGRSDRKEMSAHLLEMTRMAPFRTRRAGNLSGGMKQKLALMCTLLHRPSLLLLDEPTAGVDPVSRKDFWVLLRRLSGEGMTVFLSTSYMDEAERCDRVGLMHRGRLIRCDAPEMLKDASAEVCLEVAGVDVMTAKKVLEGRPGVVSVEPAGDTLHLFLEETGTSVDDLKRALEETGAGNAVFARIRPSLEDAFIALILKEARSPSPPARG